MSYYGRREVTQEDIDWLFAVTETLEGPGNRRLLRFNPEDRDDSAYAVFSDEGVDFQPAASGVSFPWQDTWKFANVFYTAKRVYEHTKKEARFEARRSAAAAKRAKPSLRLVTKAEKEEKPEVLSEAKLNRLERAAERKAEAEKKHLERQAKAAKHRSGD